MDLGGTTAIPSVCDSWVNNSNIFKFGVLSCYFEGKCRTMLLSPGKISLYVKFFSSKANIFSVLFTSWVGESSERCTKAVLFWKDKSNCWSEGCSVSELQGFGWCIDGVNYTEECTTCTALYWRRLVCRWKWQSGRALLRVSGGLTYQPPDCKHFISSCCQKCLCVARCLGFNLKGKASRRACLLPPPLLTVLS